MTNGNGMPEFDLTLGTAFKVIERNANPKATEKMTEKMIIFKHHCQKLIEKFLTNQREEAVANNRIKLL